MKKANIVLRDPIPGDYGWIISNHGDIYSREFHFDQQFEIDIARKIITLCDNPGARFKLWIAEVDGERAGSMAVSKLTEATAFANFVLVLNKYRGMGIAKTLMNKIIEHCKTSGFKTLRLETYSCLQDARELYKTTGFQMTESTKNMQKYGQTFDQEFWELNLPDPS